MEKYKLYEQVDVSLPGYQYPVIISHGGLDNLELLPSFVNSQQVLIVTNQKVAPIYLKKVQAVFSEIQCDAAILADGEEYKNKESLFAIYDVLVQNKHHRDSTLIALGGGVITDLAGFAAATYQRGIPFISIPTTLLAQIDAAVGGKTGINHPLGKNMIGSFYQPQAVIIDLNTLNTLPEREFRAGLAEMIKYSFLTGGALLEELSEALRQNLNIQSPQLPEFIAQCCRIKAQIVASDEKESSGQRALLNLGHTFAHALEAYTHYTFWLHGEAVAIGLYCAAVLSHNMGLITQAQVNQVELMLKAAKLPYRIPQFIDLEQLKSLMSLDKKIKNKCLPFVVMRQFGHCYLDNQVTEECLDRTLGSVQEQGK